MAYRCGRRYELGWIDWILTLVLVVFFAYFYTSMVFNPEETSDNLRKQVALFRALRRFGYDRLHQARD
ncbi:MAG: hypothetical protein ACLT98_02200 [Eggerthellaceae bacterium]